MTARKTSPLVLALVTCMSFLAAPAGAVGLLIPKDNRLGPLGIKYHRATVTIKDRAAETRVEEVFVNPTGRDLEATYIFPLPRGATVSDFYLYINGKRTKGEILEKNRARNIYEGIVRRMRDPGLLEYLGNDLFRCRVYPVPRRGEQKIEIVFNQVLPYEAGIVKYLYPMKVGRTPLSVMKDFTISVNIQSNTPIKSIYSPSHTVYHRKRDDHHAVAGLETQNAVLDRDFELFYTVSDKEVGVALLAHRPAGEPGYFMLLASPSSDVREKEIMGKEIVFVVDTSGSMSGPKMEHARKALLYCLDHLGSDDRFNIVRFSTDVETFSKKSVPASRANIERARRFVKGMEAAGGTAIHEALETAFKSLSATSGPRMIAFITDGHPTVGETDPDRIAKDVVRLNKDKLRVFVFGIGEEINTKLLDRLAADSSADATYVRPDRQIEQEISSFYDKVSHPVMTDIEIDFGEAEAFQVMPKRLPDLFKGSQVIVLGRYRGRGHTAIKVSGLLGGKRRRFVFETKFPAREDDNQFVARLWAIRRVGYLLESIRLNGEQKELVDEVKRLSKRYGIVTPYTSYLVVEDTAVAQRPIHPRPIYRHRATGRFGGDKDRTFRVIRTNPSAPPEGEASLAGAARPAEAAAPAAKAKRYRRMARAGSGGLQAVDGAMAVTAAESVRELKKAEVAQAELDEVAAVRFVEGRTFRFQSGRWTDLGYRSGMKVVKVKYLSKAYFDLISRSARLKKILSLGQNVLVVVSERLALEIGPEGAEKLPAGRLEKIVSAIGK